MSITQRCGTGDTGCNGCHDYMYPMFDNMCNGVFSPVCAPEICNVPRAPHHEILAEGQGILLNSITNQPIRFNIFIERTMQIYKGIFELYDSLGNLNIQANELKFFESNGNSYLFALFYEESTNNITVTIHQNHMLHSTQIFINSASLMTDLINLTETVISGNIKLYADHNVHAH